MRVLIYTTEWIKTLKVQVKKKNGSWAIWVASVSEVSNS